MNSVFGAIKFVESPFVQPVPVLQLHPDFPWCTPEFRAKTNAWLLERFGMQEVAYMFQSGTFGVNNGRLFVANPKQLAILRSAVRRGGER
jgi:hypothetical protein